MSWTNGHWKSSAELGTSGQGQIKQFGTLKSFWENQTV